MIYRPTWFEIRELVPPDVFEARGEAAWELLDPRLLVTLDALRQKFGPIVVNDWHRGGQYKESGFRSALSETGARYSQHRYGRAADCKFVGDVTPQEVHAHIMAHPEEFPEITTLEAISATPTWLHVDVRNNSEAGLRVVNP